MTKTALTTDHKKRYWFLMDNFWESSGWEQQDRHLKKIAEMPFERKFPFMPKKKGLYIIRGPRQIGKSSWLKTVLSHYASKEKCYYLSCENIANNKELAEVLKMARGCKLILLDEISFVQNWDRAIKHEVDLGRHHIIMITGSHAYDLKKGSDQMPGRFDGGGEFNLLPMLFDEFHQMRSQAGYASKNIVEELETFFKIGGFPDAVAEAKKKGHKPTKAMTTYWKWLQGDIVKLGKQINYLEEVIIQLGVCMQTPISFQTLSKKTSIGSHNTAQEYISILESCFAIRQLNAIDLNSGSFQFKKNKKFYFTDPLLYNLSFYLSGKKISQDYNGKVAEMVANEYLARKHRRFGYVNNRAGEIDFILPGEWAREVKWSNFESNMSKAYLNLVMPNKKIWTKHNFLK